MKKFAFTMGLLLSTACIFASTALPPDTTFQYNNKTIVISDKDKEMNISVYRQNTDGDTVRSEKIYEGIFTEERTIERRYENNFDISIPDVFKPKKKKQNQNQHKYQWGGFGVGFSNLPAGFNFNGELASVLNLSRSLQYNLNPVLFTKEYSPNFRVMSGIGFQFNSIHLQSNKAIEVQDYKSVITTTAPGMEYSTSRLHYTYATFPLLVETSFDLGKRSVFYINGGIVGKVKVASSSKVWWKDENGKHKNKLPGDLNIRPATFDFLLQAGINDIGIFTSYTPFSLFTNNKGPKGNQATIGLHYSF